MNVTELVWARDADPDEDLRQTWRAEYHLIGRRGELHLAVCGAPLLRATTRYFEEQPDDPKRWCCEACVAFADAQARSYPDDPS